ncbi:MAG: Radical SAM, Pyruvate-formate lyase-activating enzyme like [Candidatus Ozemobacter sibiricus]|uniref:Radical SAM, Pyruvate-formate lyase-activating enzyme like n=1 Tax=Candidatus Ozemobacter sibiricus TaxID=2268124 RepID=A0A367ZLA4_9BACT|nr:MAG: Radical SAM, Pyruvate-formate lyase-activating enzyme like [Candidatus Ozemobacter sibiricus]
MTMRHAEYWEPRDDRLDCRLCPNRCLIAEGRRGRCHGRGARNGQMILYNYSIVVAAHLDPIEKKPLYHFFPGSNILSVGTFGCNLSCRFCQNCEISQEEVPGEEVSPARLAEMAARTPGNIGVAFTYTEPGIWFEYIKDTAPLLRQAGQQVALVTNGFLEDAPWRELCGLTDAMNIDLKSFRDEFYRGLCGGQLAPLLRNIETAVRAGVHVELTTLVVTGRNDDPAEFEELVRWVAALSPEIPHHISRYFPRFRETAPPTPTATLAAFAEIARRHLRYVYVGNADLPQGQDTVCPACGTTVITRHGYRIRAHLAGNRCRCGQALSIRVRPPAEQA